MSYSVYSKILPPNVHYLKNIEWYRLNHTLKSTHARASAQNLQVLFKNKHFLIVNKPYDLVVYDFKPGPYKPANTLMDILGEKFPIYYDPRLRGGFHVLHRLDAVTSGCFCVPLNYFSFRVGLEAFVKKKAEKFYLALVYGLVSPQQKENYFGVKNNLEDDSFLIVVPVGDNSEQIRYSRCTPIDRTGKTNPIQCLRPQEASTQVKVLEYGTYKGKPCTKLLLKPLTGRRHQLRVHMQYLGYPIVGDLCYGVEDFETYRTMLHAYRLKIKIDTKERMFVKAKANDPFLNDIDADWKPDRILHRLEQLKI